MECLGRYTFLVMTSVILSGGMKMRDEHGKLREVYNTSHVHLQDASSIRSPLQVYRDFLIRITC